MPIGLTMPLAKSSSSMGFLASSDTEIQATYYNLKALLLTNWGERPNHFHLGCNLGEFLFAQQSHETKERIIQRIEAQVSEWLPYVTLENIDVSYTQEHKIVIKITFSARGRQDMSSVVEVTVFPQGG